jgi:hypothetical protein
MLWIVGVAGEAKVKSVEVIDLAGVGGSHVGPKMGKAPESAGAFCFSGQLQMSVPHY